MIKPISGLTSRPAHVLPTDPGTIGRTLPVPPVSQEAGAPPPGLSSLAARTERVQLSARPRTASPTQALPATPTSAAAASQAVCDYAEKVWVAYKADGRR